MLFDWDDWNTSHIARHGISRTEVEEVLESRFLIDLYEETADDEPRLAQLGQTQGGRVLVVITTEREKSVRPITAFSASPARRKQLRELMVTYAAEIADS